MNKLNMSHVDSCHTQMTNRGSVAILHSSNREQLERQLGNVPDKKSGRFLPRALSLSLSFPRVRLPSQKRGFRGHKTDVYQCRNDRCEREKKEGQERERQCVDDGGLRRGERGWVSSVPLAHPTSQKHLPRAPSFAPEKEVMIGCIARG